jgi:predicted RNase H-like HicB family nuclease
VSWRYVTFEAVKPITYCVYREGEFFVSQCLNVDMSSFGSTREEAIANLKEAVDCFSKESRKGSLW